MKQVGGLMNGVAEWDEDETTEEDLASAGVDEEPVYSARQSLVFDTPRSHSR